jgi:hypothetical protein
MHQKSFGLFLVAVLAAAGATVAIFVATATGEPAESGSRDH